MRKESINDLRVAIETQHGGNASLAQSVPVHETFKGETVWEGVVHVFDLDGHPKATRAYAWSSPIGGSDKRRFYAVLHLGRIRSPADAVRAAIVAEHRWVNDRIGPEFSIWTASFAKERTGSAIQKRAIFADGALYRFGEHQFHFCRCCFLASLVRHS